MNFHIIKILLLCVSATFSQLGNTLIIDNGAYTTDTRTSLDWLDLTATQDQSFNEVSARIAMGGDLEGWVFATAEQFDSLMIGYGATPMTCADGNSFCGASTENNGIVAMVLNDFGDLTGSLDSRGMLAETWPEGHVHALLYDNPDVPGGWTAFSDNIYTELNASSGDFHGFWLGSFLVRENAIPLPSTIFLILIPLYSLFWRKIG